MLRRGGERPMDGLAPVRKAPEVTRDAIRQAALAAFRHSGYHGTTLQEIAEEVRLSRGAVLHHFNSKSDLLNAVLDPYVSALDELLKATVVGDPPTGIERQLLLSQLAALVLDHRDAVELLVLDIAACDQLDSAHTWAARLQRLTTLLAGTNSDDVERIQAAAAIGALFHPASCAWLDLDTAEGRAALTDASVAAIGYATATSGRS
jgi:AcrR family transcriptional regulator